MHSVPPKLGPLVHDERDRLIDAWNTVLKDVPKMRFWTVEQMMEQVDRLKGIDLG